MTLLARLCSRTKCGFLTVMSHFSKQRDFGDFLAVFSHCLGKLPVFTGVDFFYFSQFDLAPSPSPLAAHCVAQSVRTVPGKARTERNTDLASTPLFAFGGRGGTKPSMWLSGCKATSAGKLPVGDGAGGGACAVLPAARQVATAQPGCKPRGGAGRGRGQRRGSPRAIRDRR